jgi:hypothetical protein
MTAPEHLAGPWQAVLADIHGWVYDSVEDAVPELDELEELDYDDFTIYIVRRASLPVRVTGRDRLRMPGVYSEGDVAHMDDDFQLVDTRTPATGGAARLAQARAMAEGLNRAAAEARS